MIEKLSAKDIKHNIEYKSFLKFLLALKLLRTYLHDLVIEYSLPMNSRSLFDNYGFRWTTLRLDKETNDILSKDPGLSKILEITPERLMLFFRHISKINDDDITLKKKIGLNISHISLMTFPDIGELLVNNIEYNIEQRKKYIYNKGTKRYYIFDEILLDNIAFNDKKIREELQRIIDLEQGSKSIPANHYNIQTNYIKKYFKSFVETTGVSENKEQLNSDKSTIFYDKRTGEYVFHGAFLNRFILVRESLDNMSLEIENRIRHGLNEEMKQYEMRTRQFLFPHIIGKSGKPKRINCIAMHEGMYNTLLEATNE